MAPTPVPAVPSRASVFAPERDTQAVRDSAALQRIGSVDEEFVWVGDGVRPNATEVERALDVLAAVPRAGAVGWSVRGQPWCTHPRRLRTAVVPPGEDWDIRCMRGVREVDSLSGVVLARRSMLGAVKAPPNVVGSAPNSVAASLRSAGFQLLLMGAPEPPRRGA